jgi:hypothetical protein
MAVMFLLPLLSLVSLNVVDSNTLFVPFVVGKKRKAPKL